MIMVVTGKRVTIGLFRTNGSAYTFRIVGKLADKPTNKQQQQQQEEEKRDLFLKRDNRLGFHIRYSIFNFVGLAGFKLNLKL